MVVGLGGLASLEFDDLHQLLNQGRGQLWRGSRVNEVHQMPYMSGCGPHSKPGRGGIAAPTHVLDHSLGSQRLVQVVGVCPGSALSTASALPANWTRMAPALTPPGRRLRKQYGACRCRRRPVLLSVRCERLDPRGHPDPLLDPVGSAPAELVRPAGVGLGGGLDLHGELVEVARPGEHAQVVRREPLDGQDLLLDLVGKTFTPRTIIMSSVRPVTLAIRRNAGTPYRAGGG